MKTLVAVAAVLLFSTGAYAAAPEDSSICRLSPHGQMPSFCEPEAPAVKKPPAKAPAKPTQKVVPQHQYNKSKVPPPRRAPPPQRRYHENPLFLIPSLFGLIAAKTYDRVEGGVAMTYNTLAKPVGLQGNLVERGVSKVYNGTKTTIGLGTAAAFDGVNALVPDR